MGVMIKNCKVHFLYYNIVFTQNIIQLWERKDTRFVYLQIWIWHRQNVKRSCYEIQALDVHSTRLSMATNLIRIWSCPLAIYISISLLGAIYSVTFFMPLEAWVIVGLIYASCWCVSLDMIFCCQIIIILSNKSTFLIIVIRNKIL